MPGGGGAGDGGQLGSSLCGTVEHSSQLPTQRVWKLGCESSNRQRGRLLEVLTPRHLWLRSLRGVSQGLVEGHGWFMSMGGIGRGACCSRTCLSMPSRAQDACFLCETGLFYSKTARALHESQVS